jgi:hypothetical protein
MRTPTYNQMLNSARNRFAELLELREDLREFLARGPNWEAAEYEAWCENNRELFEWIAGDAIPHDISDNTVLTLIREKPELLSREAYGGGDSIRKLAIEGVRDLIERDIAMPLGLHESQYSLAMAPKP